ncbi:MAG TPA: c-type cytochrome [Burkholderiales bacterium]
MDTHDSHSSFIKTPQQLVVVVLLAFLVPIIGIVMVVTLVVSRPDADPNAMTPEAVAARIQPVGRVEFGAGGGAAAGTRTGEEIVKAVCTACHQAGVANAPKLGDKAQWAPRIEQGLSTLVASVVKGKGAMPPKAGDPSLTDEEIASAVVLMANEAGASFKAPAAPKPKPAAATSAQPAQAAAQPAQAAAPPAKPAAAEGKAVYDQTCVACHMQSVAGSPKLGDKAAWAPRIDTGMDSLVQSVLKGKGAMPPKGGNASLSEAQVRSAVEFMVSQSK